MSKIIRIIRSLATDGGSILSGTTYTFADLTSSPAHSSGVVTVGSTSSSITVTATFPNSPSMNGRSCIFAIKQDVSGDTLTNNPTNIATDWNVVSAVTVANDTATATITIPTSTKGIRSNVGVCAYVIANASVSQGSTYQNLS